MNDRSIGIADLQNGQVGVIANVQSNGQLEQWGLWLESMGFWQGQRVKMQRRPLLPGGAYVLKVGTTSVALTDQEAACVALLPINSDI